MPQPSQHTLWKLLFCAGLVGTAVFSSPRAIAQIRPDTTLGNQRSVVTPNVTERGVQIDRIDGGARRGSNLFHSFSDFNVNRGQRVYFANPTSIDNIIGRVTGQSRSDINGVLGVLGNANFFLINPNGIVFGPQAQLDVRGAFFASTANRLSLGNGLEFSATNPEAPPLIVVNIQPGLQYGAMPAGVAIANQGNLQSGGDLTLAADVLNLRGQLRAGRDLSLLASNTLIARDSATVPLLASAGNHLLVQGDRRVDIAILNHPNSGLMAGGDLVLRSANPVNTDAHFWSGGDFRTEQLDGQTGAMASFFDPIIRARGDVSFGSYIGASLHIFAGGSVTADGIIITAPDATTGFAETVTLSNGTPVAVNGRTRPTLDVRAGTTAFSPAGTTGDVSGFAPNVPGTGQSGTSADISIGTIINPTGLVLLTNQYQPNATLAGNITVGDVFTDHPSGGGSVLIDSRGSINLHSIDVSGYDAATVFDTFEVSGRSGVVTLLADGEIRIPYVVEPFPAGIYAWGFRGGAITLDSDTAIVIEDAPIGATTFSTIQNATSNGVGRPIRLLAPSISIGGVVESLLLPTGTGQSSHILIRADRDLRLDQATVWSRTFGNGSSGNVTVSADAIAMDFASITSEGWSLIGGDTGTVNVTSGTLNGINGSRIGTLILGTGNAGNVTVNGEAIAFSGYFPPSVSFFGASGILSNVVEGAEGNSGSITIATDTLSLQNGAAISTSSYGVGNAGSIDIRADRSISIDGTAIVDFTGGDIDPVADTYPSGIGSELPAGATGRGGDIAIATPILRVTNGGTISTSTAGNGPAGNITIIATESASFDGFGYDGPENEDRRSSARVQTIGQTSGDGGTLTITTPNLSITQGAQLIATTEGNGNSGDILLNLGTLTVDGTDSAILANTVNRSAGAGSVATGDGGNISIAHPDVIRIQSGGRIAVDSRGTGEGGTIQLQAGSLVLNQGLISAETVSNTGGDIVLNVEDVIAMGRDSRISTTAGTAGAGGDGGNITINTLYLAATPNENNDITANAFTGRGGQVSITADGIFGLIPRSRQELEVLLGTTDPAQLDPIFLPTSDITAISQANPNLNGTVVIQTPNTDPTRGIGTLPANLVDASQLVAQGCSAGNNVAQRQGSLIVTGRGGLPPSPADHLREDNVLIGWETLPSTASLDGAIAPPNSVSTSTPIIEAQALVPDADGRMALIAQAPGGQQSFWSSAEACTP